MSYIAGNLTAALRRYCTIDASGRMLPASLQPDMHAMTAQYACHTCAKVRHVHMQGMSVAGKRNLGLLQRQDLAAAAPVKRVLEALELFELMETLLQVSKHPVIASACPTAPAQD